MAKDFFLDSFSDLRASDFLSESEIEQLTAPRELSAEDSAFWTELSNDYWEALGYARV